LLFQPLSWLSWRKSGLAGFLVAAALFGTQVLTNEAEAKETSPFQSRLETVETVALAALPGEAQTTHRLVLAGGPFPNQQDGTVFGNRERILPRTARGFYREYTVATPGARHRGARRLVCGGKLPENPDVCYYTDDHYSSFKRVVER